MLASCHGSMFLTDAVVGGVAVLNHPLSYPQGGSQGGFEAYASNVPFVVEPLRAIEGATPSKLRLKSGVTAKQRHEPHEGGAENKGMARTRRNPIDSRRGRVYVRECLRVNCY